MGLSSTTEDRVFLDVNILMEIFFYRLKQQQVSDKLNSLPDDVGVVTSVLAISTLFYYVEKNKYDKDSAHKFVAAYKKLDVNDNDYNWAKNNDLGDFEDALQVACAIRHGCTKFMTLDWDLAKRHNKHIGIVKI